MEWAPPGLAATIVQGEKEIGAGKRATDSPPTSKGHKDKRPKQTGAANPQKRRRAGDTY